MKKKSFWKRGNRGFWVSMLVLVGVVTYVAVTQIMLAGEKKDIRAVTDQLVSSMETLVQTPAAEKKDLSQHQTKAAALRDSLKRDVAGLFVKDAGYLDESVGKMFSAILYPDYYDQAEEITSLKRTPKKDDITIRVDGDTAVMTGSYSYAAAGRWEEYDDHGNSQGITAQKGFLTVDIDISFVKENDNWKIYRISNILYGRYV